MLRTNSKQARKNVVDYIREWDDGYATERASEDGIKVDFSDDAAFLGYLYSIFKSECWRPCDREYYHGNEYAAFKYWASGLAMGGLFCYWWNREAVEDVAKILDETEAEKNRFTEDQACDFLTRLIYRAFKEGK